MLPKYNLSNPDDVEDLYNILDRLQAGLVLNDTNEWHEDIREKLEAVTVEVMAYMEDMQD